eukprot:scaffold71972_cov60-Phaeocystis_antarctica.AAC.2
MSHRHPKGEPCAVVRYGEHVQGRGGSELGSSLAGRTRSSNNLKCRKINPRMKSRMQTLLRIDSRECASHTQCFSRPCRP